MRSLPLALAAALAVVEAARADSPVADAAMREEAGAVSALIAAGADVRAAQADGTTALHWAADAGDLGLVDDLLAAGADPNAVTRAGATPLQLAALDGNGALIGRLLEAGGDPNQGALVIAAPPLLYAARSGDIESVTALLDAGADVNARESHRGTTALMWAAEEAQAAMAIFLIARGADPAAQSKVSMVPARGAPPFTPRPAKPPATGAGAGDPAAADASAELEDAVAEAAPAAPAESEEGPKLEPRGGVTALALATREGSIETVTALLDAGAPIDQPTADGSTPLLVAVQNAELDIANLLLDRGADPAIANQWGWTPLYHAVKNRSLEQGDMPHPDIDMDRMYALIERLIAEGADVNARVTANTEVHSTVVSTWLLEPGATPFLRASWGADLPVMRLLLEHGADPMINASDGTTPLMALVGVGWQEGFLDDVGDGETASEAFDLLVGLGVDVHAKNNDQLAAIHGAAHKNFVYAIEQLAARDVDLVSPSFRRGTFERQADFKGHTPLDWAYGVMTGGGSSVYNAEAVEAMERMLNERGLPLTRMMTTDGGRLD